MRKKHKVKRASANDGRPLGEGCGCLATVLGSVAAALLINYAKVIARFITEPFGYKHPVIAVIVSLVIIIGIVIAILSFMRIFNDSD